MRLVNLGRVPLGPWCLASGMVFAGLLLAGCQTQSPEQKFSDLPGFKVAAPTPATGAVAAAPAGSLTAPPAGASAPAASRPSSQSDRPSVGDTLVITFSDLPPPPLQPMEERIREDGKITLLFNQAFTAAGKTLGELAKEVRAVYVPKYFVNMTVSIKPLQNTQFYYVGGEVRQPNRQVYINRITVLTAIQSAGDFTDFAKKKAVVLTRADGRKFEINCIKARQDPKLDLEVYPGDQIFVPRRLF